MHRTDNKALKELAEWGPDWPLIDEAYAGFAGKVVSPGESLQEIDVVGRWEPTIPGQMRTTVELRPGEYVLAAAQEYEPTYVVHVEPIVIRPGEVTDLRLDMADAREWRIGVRSADGGRCGFRSGPRWLSIEGAHALPLRPSGRIAFGYSPSEHEPEFPFVIKTFGRPPDAVELRGAPGANGWSIPLRPPTPRDDIDGVDFVVEVPELAFVFADVTRLGTGLLSGSVDGCFDDPDLHVRVWSSPPREHPTVGDSGERGVLIFFRGDRCTGVITERPANGGAVHVRDWFTATADGVDLMNDAKGRFIDVHSECDEYAMVRLRPHEREGVQTRTAFTAFLKPGERCRVWIPTSARQLEWSCSGEPYRSTQELHADSITIR